MKQYKVEFYQNIADTLLTLYVIADTPEEAVGKLCRSKKAFFIKVETVEEV